MYTVDSLFKNILDSGFILSNDALNELQLCDNIPSLFRVLINNLNINDDTIHYINTNIIMAFSSLRKDCYNCCSLIIEGTNDLWSYILEYFDDSQLSSLIINLYLCIVNSNIKIEYILKVYGILFSNQRAVEILTEMETFYDEKASHYINNYNTFLGIVMNKISISETNYVSRVQKMVDLFTKLMKNGEVKSKFLGWFGGLVNSSKNFKNNFIFDENYDGNILHSKYLRLLMNILLVFWNNCKQKRKCKFQNINMEYYKFIDSIINFDDKTLTNNLENKFMNDIFFMIVGLLSIFYNNLSYMEKEYKIVVKNLKVQMRQFILSSVKNELKDKYLDKITRCQLEVNDIEFCQQDKNMNIQLKNFQKDLADILNIKLKNKEKVNNMVLETNIDLINNLKIFEDNLFNYNFTNFENSVILINYKFLRNPYIRNKYTIFSTYYITDNKSRNVCDLRFKSIENILVQNLIHFYIDMEDLQDDTFYEKPLARCNVINFLNFIVFKEPYIYGVQVERYAKSFDTKFIRFVNLYINDLSGFFDETFYLIREINKLEKDNIFVSLNETEDSYLNLEKHKKLYDMYQSIKVNLEFLKNMFNFLVILTNESQEILLSKELGEKFCSQINYYLNEITCKNKRKFYNIKNKYDVGFLPLNFLDFLIKIILSCINHNKFVDYMAKDTRSYKSENIKYAINKLWSNHLITKTELDKLNTISKIIDKKKKEEEDIDIPEEFCDPLLACEICEPVILPNTDIIMEKSVISRHLLTDLHNPFNREPLTLEKLESFNHKDENKRLIKSFLEKKELWKKNNI